ncbi:MAG: GTP-binding protein, partial [Erysipelotrichaceae bacterium]|nr:GTP-binding protein [Erysipelotrichaceae bacterium]
MTEINVISGFLGAGKTTFIKELLKENEAKNLVLIENEFGEVGVDSDFLQEAGIQIKELNSGCICCSLVGDFTEALHKVVETYHPSRIIIEPSGVGKLSDIKKAIDEAKTLTPDLHLDGSVVIVDVKKCKMYARNFKEFYEDQIHYADMIILSHVDTTTEEKVNETVEIIRDMNKTAKIVTTDYHLFSATELMNLLHQEDEMQTLLEETHHHHHHEHDENCTCGCHDHD